VDDALFLGAAAGGASPQFLPLSRANRHGLIAGATGTGKTVTLQGLVEAFSVAGVPCLVSDVKGDLSGLAMPGSPSAKLHSALAARAAEVGDADWRYAATPVQFWDPFGRAGHPVRTTVSEMGPLLLGRLMDLSPAQQGVLAIAFRLADEEGLLLLDLDDLQSMLAHVADRASELTATYGNVSRPSVGAIQRSLLQLRSQGGEVIFGEPALDLSDLIGTDDRGLGLVNLLDATALSTSPGLYAALLLWLLSELWERLPEVGDPDKPVLCLFFDEAHLLFDDAPDALVDKVEQVVRLIRSKGIGVYFITQNPLDVPDRIGAQLGHRIQHALRAFTPREQAAVRAAATSFRTNPALDTAEAITQLRVGEALVSLLGQDGAPSPVERVLIRPPRSRVGPVTAEERAVLVRTDAIGDRYDALVDRESAHELLSARAEEATRSAAAAKSAREAEKQNASRAKAEAREERERANDPWSRAARSAASSAGRQIAGEVTRAVLGRGVAGRVGGALLRGMLGGLFRR